ncbi:IS200/IS605 family accessory protein TnpB-related protein [Natranaerofaba carboxydovora]|uniref:IS200/IS605 family accessory protein TnpB-related protein n=1 Tax=Natranaerofaba carboxydovora TaxID=2742683 RepID=UPI001F140288|nr:IS200/IS605 family accessory protein TnpB-related protein [Natranaerofaba carboxydovora]UMZ74733.1 tspaseT_teng_C: transposase, IS605 OrfB family [Natranaerofaba carboxydovora]
MATKTIKLKIIDPNMGKLENLQKTKDEINKLLSFYIDVIADNMEILDYKFPMRELERLTIRTRDNPEPEIPLNEKHNVPPSVLKRSIINHAIGKMNSYRSNYNNWLKNKNKNAPRLPKPNMSPTFYNNDFSLEFEDIQNQFIKLRVFDGNKWSMVNYPTKLTEQFNRMHKDHFKHQEIEAQKKELRSKLKANGYSKQEIKEIIKDTFGTNPYYKMCSPSLSFKKGEWYLCFPFKKKINMKKLKTYLKDKPELITMAIDLGISHLAVITIKQSYKLLKTEFISGKKVNCLRYQALQKITKKQRLSGKPVKSEKSNKKLWDYTSNLNKDTAHKVSARIVELAKEYGVEVVIFEHLKSFKQKKGASKAKKMNLKRNYWLHGKIIKYTRYKAYHEKIYVTERSAFMTSQIHYKDKQVGERFSLTGNGCSLIIFEDGKILNADFNGSMNLHRKFYRVFPRINKKDVKERKAKLRNQNFIAI